MAPTLWFAAAVTALGSESGASGAGAGQVRQRPVHSETVAGWSLAPPWGPPPPLPRAWEFGACASAPGRGNRVHASNTGPVKQQVWVGVRSGRSGTCIVSLFYVRSWTAAGSCARPTAGVGGSVRLALFKFFLCPFLPHPSSFLFLSRCLVVSLSLSLCANAIHRTCALASRATTLPSAGRCLNILTAVHKDTSRHT